MAVATVTIVAQWEIGDGVDLDDVMWAVKEARDNLNGTGEVLSAKLEIPATVVEMKDAFP